MCLRACVARFAYLCIRRLVVDGASALDLHGREVRAVQALGALAAGDGDVPLRPPKETNQNEEHHTRANDA